MRMLIKKMMLFIALFCAVTCFTGCMGVSEEMNTFEQVRAIHNADGQDFESLTMEDRFSGRLTIPDVGVDVALYACSSLPNDSQQEIVDAEDSAAYQQSWDFQEIPEGRFIADHNYQGFAAIRDVVANETKAFIKNGDTIEEYICVAVGEGSNLGSELVDWNGVSLNYDYIAGDLAMYTCNETWESITITYWQLIDAGDSSV